MKAKKDKPKAKAKPKKAAAFKAGFLDALSRVAGLEDRVTRLEQAQSAIPAPQPQSLPEGGLPPQGVA